MMSSHHVCLDAFTATLECLLWLVCPGENNIICTQVAPNYSIRMLKMSVTELHCSWLQVKMKSEPSTAKKPQNTGTH